MPPKKKLGGRRPSDAIPEVLTKGLEMLLPFLRNLDILPEATDVSQIRDVDIKALAEKWNVPLIDLKSGHILSFGELIQALGTIAERIALRRAEERYMQPHGLYIFIEMIIMSFSHFCRLQKSIRRQLRLESNYQEAMANFQNSPDSPEPPRPASSIFDANEEEKDPFK